MGMETRWHAHKRALRRIFEYALGSVCESMTWYQAGQPVLGDVVFTRLNDLEEVRRLLLAIIPRERARRGRLTKQ